ncbi:MAG: DUF3078 domain-containing protein [Bacteroidales bacterium]|nr:DUF3078 domain-containing protein [Bacteroidales bacterium]
MEKKYVFTKVKCIETTVLSLLIAVLVSFGSLSSFAQEEVKKEGPWKTGGDFSLSFSQLSLSNSWSAGGENSTSLTTFMNLFANYSKGKMQWDNSLGMAYGLVKLKSDDAKKSDDKIDFTSKLGFKASKKWNYSALLNFKTQFAKGFDYSGEEAVMMSNLLSPAYLVLSLGMDYKPSDIFSLYLSPMSLKSTFVMDQTLSDAGAFGVDAGQNYRAEVGAFVKAELKKEIFKNINLMTSLNLFSNYFENPENVDVDWQVQLNMKINKYISTHLHTHLIYDYDVVFEDKNGVVQFKELFGTGISFNF